MTHPRSALITYRTDDTPNGETFGVSGIFVSDTWLLSHGSLLSPGFFETPQHDVRTFFEDKITEMEKDLIAVPKTVARSMKFRARFNDADESTREDGCSLRLVWRCALLRKTFNEVLFSWSFEKLAKLDKSLLSIFLLLKIGHGTDCDADEGRRALTNFYVKHFDGSVPRPRRGTTVEIESAPFGNAAFLGSVSRGIVSNTLGERDCVILSDANAVPGCEGSPLFLLHESDKRRAMCGMVVAPLSWCRGEWVDYTFAANLQPCLGRILKLSNVKEPVARHGLPIEESMLLPDILDVLDRNIVVVKCGSEWGTGIVVDGSTGTIVTCSHVVREVPGSRVKIGSIDDNGNSENQGWARLVYRTRDGQPYDVAVLKLEHEQKNLVTLPFASHLPDKGTAVLTAGFPFCPSGPACCSRGVVSRRTAHVLQTTCCIQSGASGGPVVDVYTGEILGLVVCNAIAAGTEDNDFNGTLYPRFNMAVPATVLREPLMKYVKSGEVKYLESLSSNDPKVQETWNFYLSPRSKM